MNIVLKKEFEKDYIVYSDGKIFSKLKGRFQKLRRHPNGYLRATIHAKDMYVHRLVALCFIENPNNYAEVNHIDGDRTNNNVENLEWCNRSMNNKHIFIIGNKTSEDMAKIASSEKHKNYTDTRRKLKTEDIKKIRKMHEEGKSDRKIALEMNCSRGSINQIVNNKTYKEVI